MLERVNRRCAAAPHFNVQMRQAVARFAGIGDQLPFFHRNVDGDVARIFRAAPTLLLLDERLQAEFFVRKPLQMAVHAHQPVRMRDVNRVAEA